MTSNVGLVSVPCRQVAELFVAADPELAGVLGLFAVGRAEVGDVAFDRLAFEGLAFGLPAVERAGFEVEVERLAVGAGGDDAGVAEGFVERIAGGLVLSRGGGVNRRQQRSKGGEEEAIHGSGLWREMSCRAICPIVSSGGAVSIRRARLEQQKNRATDQHR